MAVLPVRWRTLDLTRAGCRVAAVASMLVAALACASLKGIEEANDICANGDHDGDETGTDCGGSCKGCGVCWGCNVDADCKSGSCFGGQCRPKPAVAMTFEAKVYSLAQEPRAIALADVPDPTDGEAPVARTEIVVANAGTRDLRRYRVDDGRVLPSRPAGAGELHVAVVAADFDGDGILDAATANPEKDQVSVLFGEDDGSLGDPQAVAAGSKPVAIAAGDLNGDAIPDLVVANSGDGTVTVLLSNGDRSFARTQVPGAATEPVAVALADFDGGGALDVAVVDGSGDAVAILLGDGAGGFASPASVTVGSGPSSVAAADFDGDQKIDLAVANFGGGTVSLLPGNGDGTFGVEQALSTSSAPRSVSAGHFDADGKADLAVALDAGSVAVLKGGTTTFTDLAVGSNAYFVTNGDVDGDGDADLLVANPTDNAISLLSGKGDGGFEPAAHYGPGKGISAVKRVNVMSSRDIGALSKTTGTVSVLLANDQHEHERISSVTAGSGTTSFAVGDLDYDDEGDLFVTNGTSDKVRIWRGRGDGTFEAGDEYGVGVNPIDVVLGRVRDTNEKWQSDDLITLNQGSNDIQVRINENDGTFGNANQFSVGTKPVAWTFADFNGDEYYLPDVAIANADSNTITLLLRDSDFLYEPGGSFPAGPAPSGISNGDFNADGKRDVVVANGANGVVNVLLGNGDGTFQSEVGFAAGEAPIHVVAQDFNLDKIWDVAVINQTANTVSILLGNGDGSLQPPVTLPVGAGPIDLVALDVNDDCTPDLVVANGGDDSVHVLVNRTNGGD